MKWEEWKTISEDASLWQDREEKGLLKAEHITDYVLRLWFEEDLHVSIYELDFYELIIKDNPGGVFEALKENDRFRLVVGDYALA